MKDTEESGKRKSRKSASRKSSKAVLKTDKTTEVPPLNKNASGSSLISPKSSKGIARESPPSDKIKFGELISQSDKVEEEVKPEPDGLLGFHNISNLTIRDIKKHQVQIKIEKKEVESLGDAINQY